MNESCYWKYSNACCWSGLRKKCMTSCDSEAENDIQTRFKLLFLFVGLKEVRLLFVNFWCKVIMDWKLLFLIHHVKGFYRWAGNIAVGMSIMISNPEGIEIASLSAIYIYAN